MYEFSVPMPYNKEAIDKLVSINKEVEKSKITSLYFSLPPTCNLFTGFEQPRNQFTKNSDYNFWKELMVYSIEKNFDVIYNFNLARPVEIGNENLYIQLDKLDKLLNKLKEIGINKLRIYNTLLLEHIHNEYPYFEIYLSTVTNYKTIYEFKNIKTLYPKIKQIVPAQDINKNFNLLNIIKNKLNIDIEIMCNDGCVQGCINFYNHHGMTEYNKNYLNGITCATSCMKLENINPFRYLCQNNHVFPWEIEEYGKIGITKFKLTGRDSIYNQRSSDDAIILYKTYLKGIDDIKILDDFPIIYFLNCARVKEKLKNLQVKDVKNLLPKIKYLKKKGHLCSSICGIKCQYCDKCAKNIQKVFEKKNYKNKKNSTPVCIFQKRLDLKYEI